VEVMTIDRVVVLRPDDPVAFLADACAAAAGAVNELRVARSADGALVDVYAELVVAYARVERISFTGTRLAVIDHLVERIAQGRRGEIVTPRVDIIDRLHGELTSVTASV
jgi:hypothetical protein